MGLRFFYSYSIGMIRAFSLFGFALGLAVVAPAVSQNVPAGAASAVTAGQDVPTRGFQTGQFLPDMELPRIDGKGMVRLGDLSGDFEKPGKKLLLIHFASW